MDRPLATAIVQVRSGLCAALAARPEFVVPSDLTGQKPLVVFGWPAGSRDRERVFTQRARFTQTPASLRAARTFRDEVGTFEVVIRVEGVGLDQLTTSTRAVEIGAVVEDHIANHASWTDGALGVVIQELVVSGEGGELAEAFNDKGSLAELAYPIRYTARLQ